MASRKSVVDDCTKVLLRTTAGSISRDRRYRAPSLDREPIAAILSKAHQFELLSSANTTKKMHELEAIIRQHANDAISAHIPTQEVAANHPMLILEQVMIMQIAVDEAASTLMLERANKSKGFTSYLKPEQNTVTRSVVDHLVELLRRPNVRSSLLEVEDINDEILDGFVAELTIQETRLFAQRFMGNSSTISVTQVPEVSEKKSKRGRPPKTSEQKSSIPMAGEQPAASIVAAAAEPEASEQKPKKGRPRKTHDQKVIIAMASEPLTFSMPAAAAAVESAEHVQLPLETPTAETRPSSPKTPNHFDELLKGFE